jgi:2,4-dienoyl-CoA reductase-like NADH-dependent reductase (Old Yellow Enzyme family)
MMELLGRVERYLKRSGTPPTRFGREAMRDPRFVADLREGRQLQRRTERRLADYLNRCEQGLGL